MNGAVSKKTIEHTRAALLARKQELIALREAQVDSERQLRELREADWADTSSEGALADMLYGLSERESRELREVLEALDRIDAGTWGRCMTCGRKIEERRLDAKPEVATCLTCAAQESRRGRELRPLRESEIHRDRGPTEIEAPEEPRLRSKKKTRHVNASDPHEAARHVLEEATATEQLAEDEDAPTPASLRYEPDDSFPDRVSWPLDQI
jgi:DnaK suppressor protein